MGDPEGWPQPSGLLPEGSSSCAALFLALDDERWAQAENRAIELINRIQPTKHSEGRRRAVAQYVQRLIRSCFDCEVFTFGSVPLKTYLPDGDIDLTAFSRHQHLKETWANDVRSVLEAEERSKDAEFRVKEVQYIQAEVKIIKCLVENIVVDISFNQLGGLCTLCFLEEVDRLIGRDHLFKRSIILVKAWCYYESRILGAHHGLISTYALETLVLYIFHVFHASLRGPLGVLYRFLEFFSNFDWDRYCVSLWGPIPLSALPDMPAEPPRKDGGPLLLSKAFLEACARAYAVFPNGNSSQNPVFSSKHLNVVDPLRTTNNLGRSVSKGNFFRIRSAFSFGAKKLGRILECPMENVIDELDKFFLNTWDRHGSGRRPDAPDHIERVPWADEAKANSEDKEKQDDHEKNSLAGEVLQGLNKFAIETQRDIPKDITTEEVGNHVNAFQEAQRKVIVPEEGEAFHDWETREFVGSPPPVWGNADVPPFYPRSVPVHANHSEEEVLPSTSEQASWEANGRPTYGHGPPPPPLNIPTDGPRFNSQSGGYILPMPLLRGPVPPPLPPPYGRGATPLGGGVQHHIDEQREKESEEFIEHKLLQPHSKLQRDLSPEASAFYEQQNGSILDEDEFERRTKFSHPSRSKDKSKLPEEHRSPEGEAWPMLEPRGVFQYQHMPNQVVYTGLNPPVPDSQVPVPASPSSDVSSPGSFPAPPPQRPVMTGIPVGSSGFLRPSSSDAGPGGHSRKHQQRPEGVPSFYYAPFPYGPVYNSFPVYVLPPEASGEGDSIHELPVSLNEDGEQVMFGEGDRLSAAGIPVNGVSGISGTSTGFPGAGNERLPDGHDLLSSDFANHLRNLDYGRACQSPLAPMFLQPPAFPPFAKELQGYFTWEGPGRPNMKHHSSRGPRSFHRSFPGPPGFSTDEVSKARTGTGTYLPGSRQSYRDRQVKAQHDGYQEVERDIPPRYQRGFGRGQNNRMKAGDKQWQENFNNRNPLPPGAMVTPMNLEAYTQAYMNGNGNNSPTGPVIVIYPPEPPLEFGSLNQMQEHGLGRVRPPSPTLQQPTSPGNQPRPSPRPYQMKEEDFPPLSFRGQGGNASSSGSTNKYQTYVASQS